MKKAIFLSYSSSQSETASRIELPLKGKGIPYSETARFCRPGNPSTPESARRSNACQNEKFKFRSDIPISN
jgi:hypothetical protein